MKNFNGNYFFTFLLDIPFNNYLSLNFFLLLCMVFNHYNYCTLINTFKLKKNYKRLVTSFFNVMMLDI